MAYFVKEVFYTLQGEGANAGRAAVFCRFTGCNLWSGREADRATAVCRFCDTDFVGGNRFDAACEVATQLCAKDRYGCRFVVFTGGEPLLQLDQELIRETRNLGFSIAIETNGTRPVPSGIDWACVSPKAHTRLAVTAGDELKLVYPQAGARPEDYDRLDFKHFFLQPMAGARATANTEAAVAYCMEHPQWRLSLQAHKLVGLR